MIFSPVVKVNGAYSLEGSNAIMMETGEPT